MALVRLQKYLADRGTGSRRKCEEYIKDGLIKVNGKIVTEMGVKVDPATDRVEVAAELTLQRQQLVYIALHKPVGYVTTVTGKEKPKVMELLKTVPERVFPVGRLDKNTSGLLLLTNDGRFAFHMTHPKFEKEKEYEVTVDKPIPEGALHKLRRGITIIGSKTQPTVVQRIAPDRFRIILREGKNRQIRRMCRKIGHRVNVLKRIRIGGLWLRKLKPGEWRALPHHEVKRYFDYEALT